MLYLDGQLRLDIDSWRLVGCTPSLHDYVVQGLCGIRVGIWLGLLLWRDKDSSGTHVFDPKQ
jgi:hypothetical protein